MQTPDECHIYAHTLRSKQRNTYINTLNIFILFCESFLYLCNFYIFFSALLNGEKKNESKTSRKEALTKQEIKIKQNKLLSN